MFSGIIWAHIIKTELKATVASVNGAYPMMFLAFLKENKKHDVIYIYSDRKAVFTHADWDIMKGCMITAIITVVLIFTKKHIGIFSVS